MAEAGDKNKKKSAALLAPATSRFLRPSRQANCTLNSRKVASFREPRRRAMHYRHPHEDTSQSFLSIPGGYQGHSLMNRRLVRYRLQTLDEVDGVIWLLVPR